MISVKYTFRGWLTDCSIPYEDRWMSVSKHELYDGMIDFWNEEDHIQNELTDTDINELLRDTGLTGKHIKITIEEEEL